MAHHHDLRSLHGCRDWCIRRFTMVGIFTLALCAPTWVLAQGATPKLAPTPRLIAQGEHLYRMRCVRCHGKNGDGNGPLADILDPRPRDFTAGMFKFRTTATGELPTDEDLFRTISRGIPGTTMPRWDRVFSEAQRWSVIYYVKTFAREFSDLEYDPYQSIVALPPQIPSSSESIAAGKKIYERNQCWECHGKEGRGDGNTGMEDGWGFPVRVPNLTRGWNLRGGQAPEDIVYRFTTGLDGTPMPSFARSISGDDRWHLANYIASIARTGFREGMILKAEQTNKSIPLDTSARIWRSARPTRVSIQGQVRVRPFWINNAVDMLEVRALYNEDEIGFLIEWDDPVHDEKHDEGQEVIGVRTRYVSAFGEIPREPGIFRDSVAVQFPVATALGKAPFFRGDANNPLNLWIWKSDLDANGKRPVEDSNARGIRVPLKNQSEAGQQVRGKGFWRDGRWRVVMIRSLQTTDRDDVQFEKDQIIPMNFNVWDGSNGEHGLIMGLSSWHLVYLDAPGSKTYGRIQDILIFYGVSGNPISK